MSRRSGGKIVAVLGVDGAGKTTLIAGLLGDPDLQRRGIRRLYFWANEFWNPGALRLHRSVGHLPGLRLFTSALLAIDRQLRLLPALWHRFRGRLVLCDRYFFDDLILASRAEARRVTPDGLMIRFLLWAGRPRMWRRPDLTLFLDLSPATAWRRKQDYPFEVMRETNRVYRQALVGLPGVSVVDAEQTSEAVKAEVVARLRALDAADPGAGAHRRAARLRFRIGKMLMAWAARTTGAGWVATRLVVAGRVWHPYVEEVSVSVRDALRQLRYRYGAGSVRLSRTGVLQFVAGGWVHAVALGPLVAQRLARGFQAWFELRAGPHATLVPYACMRECIGRWTVYRTECLEAARDGDVETVLARLQGPPCENQFDGMPFDGMRQRLAHTLGEDGQRIAGLAVEPEPGPRGLLH